jgi:hypothetical protein
MYKVSFQSGSLQFRNVETGALIYNQPFRPANSESPATPWADAAEAFEYWYQEARHQYHKISDDLIIVEQENA